MSLATAVDDRSLCWRLQVEHKVGSCLYIPKRPCHIGSYLLACLNPTPAQSIRAVSSQSSGTIDIDPVCVARAGATSDPTLPLIHHASPSVQIKVQLINAAKQNLATEIHVTTNNGVRTYCLSNYRRGFGRTPTNSRMLEMDGATSVALRGSAIAASMRAGYTCLFSEIAWRHERAAGGYKRRSGLHECLPSLSRQTLSGNVAFRRLRLKNQKR